MNEIKAPALVRTWRGHVDWSAPKYEFALDALTNLKIRGNVDSMDPLAVVCKPFTAKQYGQPRQSVTVVIEDQRDQPKPKWLIGGAPPLIAHQLAIDAQPATYTPFGRPALLANGPHAARRCAGLKSFPQR